MINKISHSIEHALSDISDGATVLIGGFGTAGIPNELIGQKVTQKPSAQGDAFLGGSSTLINSQNL